MFTITHSRLDPANCQAIPQPRPVSLSSSNLLQKSICGNREFQCQLYEIHHHGIYRLLVRMVGRTDADDVLQDVFLQVFRTLTQFKGKSQFSTWIYRVTLNQALQHLRKRRRSRWTKLEDEPVDHRNGTEDDLGNREILERALQRIEPDLRAVFLLREIEKYSYSQISNTLQIPKGTVASRLNQVRHALKQHLVELGWEP
jgi:RNA polymerase sigma-70 factor (ECF subfamily)